jgi:hypothetical protein
LTRAGGACCRKPHHEDGGADELIAACGEHRLPGRRLWGNFSGNLRSINQPEAAFLRIKGALMTAQATYGSLASDGAQIGEDARQPGADRGLGCLHGVFSKG